jgi:hypothetical protein
MLHQNADFSVNLVELILFLWVQEFTSSAKPPVVFFIFNIIILMNDYPF